MDPIQVEKLMNMLAIMITVLVGFGFLKLISRKPVIFKNIENWKAAKKKWHEIVKKTKKHEKFHNEYGFVDLRVVGDCGYCDEFTFKNKFGIDSCKKCPLYKRHICFNFYKKIRKTSFKSYLYEMEKTLYASQEKVDWKMAIKHSERIYNSIISDDPSKISM